jgi:hypothetical protein
MRFTGRPPGDLSGVAPGAYFDYCDFAFLGFQIPATSRVSPVIGNLIREISFLEIFPLTDVDCRITG